MRVLGAVAVSATLPVTSTGVPTVTVDDPLLPWATVTPVAESVKLSVPLEAPLIVIVSVPEEAEFAELDGV